MDPHDPGRRRDRRHHGDHVPPRGCLLSLTGKQRRYLRGLGHALVPVAQLGKAGITDAFVDSLDRALADHELIKIKLLESAAVDRHDAADVLAARTASEVAQVLGHTILLYRAREEDPDIELPS